MANRAHRGGMIMIVEVCNQLAKQRCRKGRKRKKKKGIR